MHQVDKAVQYVKRLVREQRASSHVASAIGSIKTLRGVRKLMVNLPWLSRLHMASPLLPSGSFSNLYKGFYCGQEVAVKILKDLQDDAAQYNEFLQEVSIMRKVGASMKLNIRGTAAPTTPSSNSLLWPQRWPQIGGGGQAAAAFAEACPGGKPALVEPPEATAAAGC